MARSFGKVAVGAFLLGVVAAPLQYALDGWWLNSTAAVLRMTTVLALVGFLLAWPRRGGPWVRGRALWAGAMAGCAVTLFWTGPGTIWPIVLVMAGGVTGAAVFGGVWLGRRLS